MPRRSKGPTQASGASPHKTGRPAMRPVQSSAVERVGYDSTARELHITYTGGGRYIYVDVGPEVYAALLSAESVGEFVNREVKPRFAFRKA